MAPTSYWRSLVIGHHQVSVCIPVFCEKVPPHEANRKGLIDAHKFCPLTPNIPFGLAKSHDGVASPYLVDQTI